MKKITKLLPALLALMLVAPAFAANDTNKTSDTANFSLTVPKFIQIVHDPLSVESANAGFEQDYSKINLDAAMVSKFKIVTNNPDEQIKLTGTAKTSDGGDATPALFGANGNNIKLIFTNQGTGARAAKAADVQNIMTGSPTIADNKNAIAFAITSSFGPDAETGAKAPTVGTPQSDGTVTYSLVNGVYNYSYTFAQQAVTGTFSPHDTDGTYSATLTLSQVNAGP